MRKILLLLLLLVSPANLFAQGYEFEPCGSYTIFEYEASIRKDPARNSDIIAILRLNDTVEILENSGEVEEINGTWGFWYKIKHKDITGYIFGGNLRCMIIM